MVAVMTQSATTWTFTRGVEAVEITRLPLPNGRWCVLVTGPGPLHRAEECDDAIASVTQQAEEERRLILRGFQLERIVGAVPS